jgi:hypothetical protein
MKAAARVTLLMRMVHMLSARTVDRTTALARTALPVRRSAGPVTEIAVARKVLLCKKVVQVVQVVKTSRGHSRATGM